MVGGQSVKCQQGPRATVLEFALRRAVLPALLPVGALGRGEGPRPELSPASRSGVRGRYQARAKPRLSACSSRFLLGQFMLFFFFFFFLPKQGFSV